MQIKKFEASSMKNALGMVKREFGSNAVILSVKKIENKKGFLGITREFGVEITAATDNVSIPPDLNLYRNEYLKSRYAQNIPEANKFSFKKKNLFESLHAGKLKYSRNGIETVSNKQDRNKTSKELYKSFRRMLDQDVDSNIAIELIRGVNDITSGHRSLFNRGFNSCLTQILEEKGLSAGRVKIADSNQKLIALVGPTGVGKTCTISKLAAAARTRTKAKKVALITIDDYRLGAIEQLNICARIIGVPVYTASSRNELETTLDKLNDVELVFIDTPGISHKDKAQMNEVFQYFQKSQNVEIHLTLPAPTNEKTLKNMIDNFQLFQAKRLIFTKLDECITFGSILNQLFRTKIPASYFTNGQQVPEDIEAASIEKLVELVSDKGSEFNYLSGSPEALAQNITRFEMMIKGTQEKNPDVINYMNNLNGSAYFPAYNAG